MGVDMEVLRVRESSVSQSWGTRAVAIGMALAIVVAYFSVLALNGEAAFRLGWEDGPIETAGALLFLIAAAGFLAASIREFRQNRERGRVEVWPPLVLALLALLMFVCFGEEISWGQRVFGWRTPPFMAGLNAQNEINLHNIQVVHQWNPDGSEKGFVGKLVNMNRLFSLFWLGVFVLLPAAALLSDRVRQRVDTVGIQVPPLWIGGLFLTSYIVYKLLAFISAGSLWAHTLDELKEASYAAIYAVAATAALIGTRGESR